MSMEKRNWVSYPERRNVVSFLKSYPLQKKVKSVFIDITAIGWYHLYINGKRVDTSVFSPGYTEYKKRVQFQRYDITSLIQDEIDLEIELAEGWGGGDRFAWTQPNVFKYFPMSINFEIDVCYEDETHDCFVSDETLDVYTNKIVDATIYYGEIQDQFKEYEYVGKAKYREIDTSIVPQEGEEIIYGERIPAKKMWKDPKGNLLIDFEQNFAGVVEIKIKAKKGDVISYRPCEVLDKDGVFYNENYRKTKTMIYSFVCSGEEDIFVPRFSFLGGRYICLVDYPENVSLENFTAVLVHSNLKKTNTFECGNPKLQRLYLNTVYGQLSNYLDIPTDCPQRDERLGWTADAHVFASTAAIHYDVSVFFKKWLRDMVLSQHEDGRLTPVVPSIHAGDNQSSTGWSDACCIIPLQMYRAYGDKAFLSENIEMMERWINYLLTQFKKPYIVELPFSFGDWLALDKIQDGECQGLTRYDLMSTAFLAHDLSLMIEACKALGRDYAKYEDLLEKVKKAYQKKFIKKGHLVGRKAHLFSKMRRTAYTQTGLAMTLHFRLCKEEDRKSLTDDLVELIQECDGKMSTGFIGTAYILSALSEEGRSDVAYSLLFQEGYPSWLYSVNKGATTMWEHYDGIKEDGSFWFASMNSFNHYAYGSVYGWIFENAVGIKAIEPGYGKILIAPKPDKRFGYIDSTFSSPHGDIRVRWEYKNGNVDFLFVTSKGMDVELLLPNGMRKALSEGEHRFTLSEEDCQ